MNESIVYECKHFSDVVQQKSNKIWKQSPHPYAVVGLLDGQNWFAIKYQCFLRFFHMHRNDLWLWWLRFAYIYLNDFDLMQTKSQQRWQISIRQRRDHHAMHVLSIVLKIYLNIFKGVLISPVAILLLHFYAWAFVVHVRICIYYFPIRCIFRNALPVFSSSLFQSLKCTYKLSDMRPGGNV